MSQANQRHINNYCLPNIIIVIFNCESDLSLYQFNFSHTTTQYTVMYMLSVSQKTATILFLRITLSNLDRFQ